MKEKCFLIIYVCVLCNGRHFHDRIKVYCCFVTELYSSHSQRQHGKEQVQRRAINMLRGLGYLFYEARLRARAVHPGEENILGRTQSTFQYLKGPQESWRGTFDEGME